MLGILNRTYAVMAIVIAAVLVIGLYAAAPYLWNSSPSTVQTQAASYTTTPPYDCGYPSNTTQFSCTTLPSGYQIAAKLVNTPPVTCLPQETAAACALLKQTSGNGVCDPNETPVTAPLDCACPGATAPDPYTGRCSDPATVCQAIGAPILPQETNKTNP